LNWDPEVPWRQIIAVRHRIVHAYFDLDWQILWDAANGDIPELQGRFSTFSQRSFRNPNPIDAPGLTQA